MFLCACACCCCRCCCCCVCRLRVLSGEWIVPCSDRAYVSFSGDGARRCPLRRPCPCAICARGPLPASRPNPCSETNTDHRSAQATTRPATLPLPRFRCAPVEPHLQSDKAAGNSAVCARKSVFALVGCVRCCGHVPPPASFPEVRHALLDQEIGCVPATKQCHLVPTQVSNRKSALTSKPALLFVRWFSP